MHLGLAFRYPGKHNIYFISLKEVNPELAHYICTQRVKKKVWKELIFDHNHQLRLRQACHSIPQCTSPGKFHNFSCV